MNGDARRQIETALHMVKCQVTLLRFGIVKNRMDIIVDAVNDVDKTISQLEDQLSKYSEEEAKQILAAHQKQLGRGASRTARLS